MKARQKSGPSSRGTTARDRILKRTPENAPLKVLGSRTTTRTVRVHPASPAHRGRDCAGFSPAPQYYRAPR